MSKIVLVSMVKNEADIIESFVRHSLTYADELIIADHQSSDGTWEILESLHDEGLPLILKRLYHVELAHREVMNGLTREAISSRHADLVLPFDADEFLVNDENDVPCRKVLDGLPTDRLYLLRWRCYEPLEPDKDRSTFLLSRPCKRENGYHSGQKTIVGAAAYTSDRPWELVQGAHWGEYLDDGSAVPMTEVPFIHTAHYHWRSSDQYDTRVATSWLNNVTKYTVNTLTASYLKGCFDQLRRHEPVVAADLLEENGTPFDLSPYVPDQTLKYTSDKPADTMGNLMAAAERIAEQCAEIKVQLRHKKVSIVCVWTGTDSEAWIKSWHSALAQTYPYREYIVLCLKDVPSDVQQQIERAAESETIKIAASVDGHWAEELEKEADGDYVQLILPGEIIHPNKVQRMITFLETQDQHYSIAFGSGRKDQGGRLLSGGYYPVKEPVAAMDIQKLWEKMLCTGQHPIGGLSAGLFTPELLTACHWLEGCFIDGRPLVFVMWRELCHAAENMQGIAGILRADFSDVDTRVAPDPFLWHQLQWALLLQDEKDAGILQNGWQAYLAKCASVKGQHELLAQSPLYPEYQRILGALTGTEK